MIRPQNRNSTVMLSESQNGNEWTAPERILNDDGYFVFNNDRIIRLKDGRLVFAVARHTVEEISTKNGKVISDITEYSSVFFDLSGETPALKSVETQTGAWVDNTYALNIGDATRNFTDSHGISFKAKSSSQWAIGQGIWVKLGGSDICFNKSENGLDISIDENVGGWMHITNLPVGFMYIFVFSSIILSGTILFITC